MNASCGMSTFPKRRMRFLHSRFCLEIALMGYA